MKPTTNHTRFTTRAVLIALLAGTGPVGAAAAADAPRPATVEPSPASAAAAPVANPSPIPTHQTAARPLVLRPVQRPDGSARDRAVTAFAARNRFTAHLGSMPGYRGAPVYAVTDMRTCQVWVSKATTNALALEVLRHEFVHVLVCRSGTHFATRHFEHVADAGAALLGSRHAFYGRFSSDDTLEAKRLLAGVTR